MSVQQSLSKNNFWGLVEQKGPWRQTRNDLSRSRTAGVVHPGHGDWKVLVNPYQQDGSKPAPELSKIVQRRVNLAPLRYSVPPPQKFKGIKGGGIVRQRFLKPEEEGGGPATENVVAPAGPPDEAPDEKPDVNLPTETHDAMEEYEEISRQRYDDATEGVSAPVGARPTKGVFKPTLPTIPEEPEEDQQYDGGPGIDDGSEDSFHTADNGADDYGTAKKRAREESWVERMFQNQQPVKKKRRGENNPETFNHAQFKRPTVEGMTHGHQIMSNNRYVRDLALDRARAIGENTGQFPARRDSTTDFENVEGIRRANEELELRNTLQRQVINDDTERERITSLRREMEEADADFSRAMNGNGTLQTAANFPLRIVTHGMDPRAPDVGINPVGEEEGTQARRFRGEMERGIAGTVRDTRINLGNNGYRSGAGVKKNYPAKRAAPKVGKKKKK